MSAALVWVRQDFRVADNPALAAACAHRTPVVAVYILDDDTSLRALGGAARWWLHHSLADMATSLRALNIPLILRRGRALQLLPEIVREIEAPAVYWNRLYEPYHIQRDTLLKQTLQEQGVAVHSFNGSLLHEPWETVKSDGTPFKVFTPFWKHCVTHPVAASLAVPTPRPAPPVTTSDSLADWALLPTKPDWAGGLRTTWPDASEAGAQQRLTTFLDNNLNGYSDERNRPDKPSTSRLSPYLHWGQISPRQIWHTVYTFLAAHPKQRKDAEKFLSEVGWREFSYHLLYHFPTLPTANLRPEFDAFPWQEDNAALRRWQRGQTGYPIIDAGMRELYATGWMHNRVRMIVASFLIKDLRIHWRAGEAWFWDTLVDADLANNSASWQWVAGSGADAAPYFRIFNPVTQGEKFDPQGDYVRRWVPELAALPREYIQQPWTASPLILKAAGVTLGTTYPLPMVDHAKARDAALAAFQTIKKGHPA